ncbi:isoprenylcysteine carboxylmethyltransferase family protein [uncultured Paraglaciecola sp.]|jgi:protein-S-isoprenylcysteine O-methyltransferase Ste14|uniref:methyltransferase family protein n=1 Tax=uncultured Paraglaciecola sp. TaxID=1765024 RepID=UPI0025F6ADC7|nr:isoprenylcysteine carboxylmethyltransferase family protein [uncultured Paraglaciecola sp.]
MKSLELKVHPPIVLALCLGLVYGLSHYLPILAIPTLLSDLYLYIGLTGVLVALAGIWEFRKAKTTINPTKPEKTSHLVLSGIYRVTRNPMYLGMLCIIIAAIFKFANFYGVIALPCFMLYITQFQIKPEERIIEGIFGEQYVLYKKKVRRWL